MRIQRPRRRRSQQNEEMLPHVSASPLAVICPELNTGCSFVDWHRHDSENHCTEEAYGIFQAHNDRVNLMSLGLLSEANDQRPNQSQGMMTRLWNAFLAFSQIGSGQQVFS